MDNVANKIIQSFVRAEALMSTVMTDDKKSPEHGALCKPVQRPDQRIIQRIGTKGQGCDDAQIKSQVSKRACCISFKAFCRNSITDVLKCEGGIVRQTTTALQCGTKISIHEIYSERSAEMKREGKRKSGHSREEEKRRKYATLFTSTTAMNSHDRSNNNHRKHYT